MTEHFREVYAGKPETKLRKKPNGKSIETTVLLGAWLGVVEENSDGWIKVKAFGKEGWVHEAQDTRKDMGLKVFFVDVGQGDACFIETQDKRILVDGGPNSNFKNYLTKWKYKWLLKAGYRVRFDAVFVSHFDADHFAGLTKIIKDDRFEIGAVYHNGIARFHSQRKERLEKYDTDLGRTNAHGQSNVDREFLKTSFSTINDAKNLLSESPGQKGLVKSFKQFLEAMVEAKEKNRMGTMKRLTVRDGHVPGFGPNSGLEIQVLGPVPTHNSRLYHFAWFKDSSHTRNGHSLVLKVIYKNRSLLLGGDLNTYSERYLIDYYSPDNPFEVDAAKACHHGASEFTVDFMKAVRPYATVFSSGDNENYAHPRADALGCAGKYGRGTRPLVFSTELARSISSADDIHYGLINLRTDGEQMMLAHMLEKKRPSDIWDSYILP